MSGRPLRAAAAPEAPAAVPARDRVARLAGVDVPWRLVRARRRTIGFVVDAGGLEVRAPARVPLAEIEAGLAEKARWIARTWQRVTARARATEDARVEWKDGATVGWRGGTLVVRLRGALEGSGRDAGPPSPADGPRAVRATPFARAVAGARQLALAFDDGPPPSSPEPVRLGLDAAERPPRLVLDLPADAAPAAVRDATRRWLEQAALDAFRERAAVHAAALGVRVARIGLSNATTRWGSARSDGSIRLHWRLVQLDPDLLDAVVAHEVAHLREMNHGPRFWALMARLVDDPDGTRRRLRAAAATLAPF